MLDAIVLGAGPAGSVAALLLARAGARVLIVDRESFPRDKLCGDTLNPGALSLLRSLALDDPPPGRPLHGMILSGPRARVEVRYGHGLAGLAIPRRALDVWLLEHAIRAGARFESGLIARGPLLAEESRMPVVRGLALAQRGRSGDVSRMPASMIIAADGIRSTLARSLQLSRAPRHPRRWAFGAYMQGVRGVGDLGEMHVRADAYVGIAPMPDGTVNVCAVTGSRPDGRGPSSVIASAIGRAGLSDRFERTTAVGAPRVLGPLAMDVAQVGVEGLLLAGDAAGFIDPMTGDGLRLAMRGAVLAAEEALRALETGDLAGAPARLAAARAAALGRKLRFNRAVRSLTSSPAALQLVSCGAAVLPALIAPLVRYAGDTRAAAAPVSRAR